MPGENVKPIIPGFWSDPTICRAGDQLVLANSSFEYFPGAPIHVSNDMLSWEHAGHVITRASQTSLGEGAASSGIYGSTLRYHDERFWFITTNVTEGERGQLLFTAESPTGPWSDPVEFPAIRGIDPDICWDEEGRCHLTWCDFEAGICSVEVDPTSGAVLSEVRHLWSGVGGRNPEGPHLYRIGEWWYLLLAEGGTHIGHMVTIARARSVEGPYEEHPDNPVLTHRSQAHDVQGVGHADLVEAPDGQWWVVFHGIRPLGGHPHYHLLGRETFAAKVVWHDGWPRIQEADLDVPPRTGFHDVFSGVIASRWVRPGDPRELAEVTPSGLLLQAPEDALGQPILTRVCDFNWRAQFEIDVSVGRALVQLRIDDNHLYGLEVDAKTVRAVIRTGALQTIVAEKATPDPTSVVVEIAASTEPDSTVSVSNPPDVVSLDGMVRLDGRYVSTEVAGGFTGRMLGVQALSGKVAVKSVRLDILG